MIWSKRLLALGLLAGMFGDVQSRASAQEADIGFSDGAITYYYQCLLFAPDDRHLLAFGFNASLHIWDVQTGKRIKTLWMPRHLVWKYWEADISPNGRLLAVEDGEDMLVIDLKTERVTAVANGHTGRIRDLAFAPDGKTLATVGADSRLKLWDPTTGKCRATFNNASLREFGAVAWSPDGQRLATSELNGPLRIWEIGTGRQRAINGIPISASKLLWRPDGQAIAILRRLQSWVVVDLDGRVLVDEKGGSRHNVPCARFNKERRLIAAGADGLVDVAGGKQAAPAPGKPRLAREFALAADGDLCAYYGRDQELVVRSLTSGKERLRAPGLPREAATRIGWSEDGKSLLWTAVRSGPIPKPVPSRERTFNLTQLKLGTALADAKRTKARLTDIDRAITDADAYRFTMTRLQNGKKLTLEPSQTADDFYVGSITLLAAERAALLSGWGLALHDTVTGRELFYYRPGASGNELAPTPDGLTFATSAGTMDIYTLDRQDRLLALHGVGEQWVAWTGDGYYAAAWEGDLPVGRFIDHGKQKLAEFVPLNRLESRHRPDVIKHLLTERSLERALKVADALRK